MILILGIVLASLLVSLWLLTMYTWWKQEERTLTPIDIHDITLRLAQIARYLRRSWYTSLLYGKKCSTWIGTHITKVFFRFFPKAELAFVKHDELTGLKNGPSSYFLKSISESSNQVPPPRRRRKIV